MKAFLFYTVVVAPGVSHCLFNMRIEILQI
jgi:hypothetical protein